MKKNLYRLILLLALVCSFATPAHARTERSLTLVSIYYVRGKGVIFTFTPQGNFKESELTGTVTIDHQTFSLACHLNGVGDVKCATERGLASFVGQIASGEVAGFSFSDVVRAGLARPTSSTPYCYAILDKIGGVWQSVSTFCGRNPAKAGDWILYNGRVADFDPKGPVGAGFYLEP
jgi:hypothetical protein